MPSEDEADRLSVRRPCVKEMQRGREAPETERVLHRPLLPGREPRAPRLRSATRRSSPERAASGSRLGRLRRFPAAAVLGKPARPALAHVVASRWMSRPRSGVCPSAELPPCSRRQTRERRVPPRRGDGDDGNHLEPRHRRRCDRRRACPRIPGRPDASMIAAGSSDPGPWRRSARQDLRRPRASVPPRHEVKGERAASSTSRYAASPSIVRRISAASSIHSTDCSSPGLNADQARLHRPALQSIPPARAALLS
jgi:hypothetical protein